jgi:hypothetical protein
LSQLPQITPEEKSLWWTSLKNLWGSLDILKFHQSLFKNYVFQVKDRKKYLKLVHYELDSIQTKEGFYQQVVSSIINREDLYLDILKNIEDHQELTRSEFKNRVGKD